MKWKHGEDVHQLYDAGVLVGYVVKEGDLTYNAVWVRGVRHNIEPMTTLDGAMTRVADEVRKGETA